jgi:hypothetical protein
MYEKIKQKLQGQKAKERILDLYAKAKTRIKDHQYIEAVQLDFEILKENPDDRKARFIIGEYNKKIIVDIPECSICESVRKGASEGEYNNWGQEESTFFTDEQKNTISHLKKTALEICCDMIRKRLRKIVFCDSCKAYYEYGEYDEGEPFIKDSGVTICLIHEADEKICEDCLSIGMEACQYVQQDGTSQNMLLDFSEAETIAIDKLIEERNIDSNNKILCCYSCGSNFTYKSNLLEVEATTIRETIIKRASELEIYYYGE